MSKRFLVIRGGGIGDFLLTLPAIQLIREHFSDSHLEILGYRRVLGLIKTTGLVDATRSIDYGPMAACFNPAAKIEQELADYFSGFDQIVSYLYDPDKLFKRTLRNLGAKNILCGNPRLENERHAAFQLAKPLEELNLFLQCSHMTFRFSDLQLDTARQQNMKFPPGPWIAIHPGSGGEHKIWDTRGWEVVISHLLDSCFSVVLVAGEADHQRAEVLNEHFGRRLPILTDLPLESLAACLSQCRLFLGHDSGISHLAATAGAPCLLLFGPTNPDVWAPSNPAVRVLRPPSGELSHITPPSVLEAVEEILR